MKVKKYSGSDGAISDINVIPLVDVILVVLIIFMVTAPMIMKPSINVNLPKAGSGDKTTPGKLNITLSVDGKIMLNGSSTDEAKIKEFATSEAGKNADVQAVISADKDVPHGKVVEIIDWVKSVGVKKFAISIDSK
jgi:biopolymer transport protein ExbD